LLTRICNESLIRWNFDSIVQNVVIRRIKHDIPKWHWLTDKPTVKDRSMIIKSISDFFSLSALLWAEFFFFLEHTITTIVLVYNTEIEHRKPTVTVHHDVCWYVEHNTVHQWYPYFGVYNLYRLIQAIVWQ